MSYKKFKTIYVTFLVMLIWGFCNMLMGGYVLFETIRNKDAFVWPLTFYMMILPLIVTSVYLLCFLIWSKVTQQGKDFWERYNRIDQGKVIDEIDGIDYYKDIPLYYGRSTFMLSRNAVRIWLFILLVVILYPTLIMIKDILTSSGRDVRMLITSLFPFIVALFFNVRNSINRITIDKNGVHVKNYLSGFKHTLKWGEIKSVGISLYDKDAKSSWNYIYFSAKEIVKTKEIRKYREKKTMLMTRYRPKIIHLVLQYWNKEILNLNKQDDWNWYVKMN
ncbi:MAG: hypothetical protein AB1Z23_01240 [Eubacteriales bacterium]